MSDTSGKLDRIAAALDAVRFVENINGSETARNKLKQAEMLLNIKLRFEVNHGGRSPLIVTVSGGANAGKSTLVSWLGGGNEGAVSPIAGSTRTPLATGNQEAIQAFTTRLERGKMSVIHVADSSESQTDNTEWVILSHVVDAFPEQHCIVIDSPDFDSRYLKNHERAEWMWALSDVVIFVVTPEKYHDEAVVKAIRTTRAKARKIIAVFNKYEEDITKKDFIEKTWNKNEPILDIRRFSPGRQPDITGFRAQVSGYYKPKDVCKRSAVEATLKELRENMNSVALHLRHECDWLSEVRSKRDTHNTRVFNAYCWDIRETEQFVELDHVIKRMLEKYETAYDRFYKKGKIWIDPAVTKLKNTIGLTPSDTSLESKLRRDRETARFNTVLDELESYVILTMGETAPEQVRPKVIEWVEEWRRNTPRPDTGKWIAEIEQRVSAWVDEQVKIIDVEIQSGPYLGTFLKYGKAALQVSFGLLGGWYTGPLGLGLQDIVIVPAVERLCGFMINLGLNRKFFSDKRLELIQKRCEWLNNHLQGYIAGVIGYTGDESRDVLQELENVIRNGLPDAKEICK